MMTAVELEALGAVQGTFGALEMCHCRARGLCTKACVCHYRLDTRQNLTSSQAHTLSATPLIAIARHHSVRKPSYLPEHDNCPRDVCFHGYSSLDYLRSSFALFRCPSSASKLSEETNLILSAPLLCLSGDAYHLGVVNKSSLPFTPHC